LERNYKFPELVSKALNGACNKEG